MVRCVRYAECHKNHAVNIGGYAVDGCREFMASGKNGISDLTCSACGCHRSFHERKEEAEESIVVREENVKKRRKGKSEVWEHFTKSEVEDGKQWAICNHCGGEFDGSSKKGTTHLKNHLESMKCRAKRNGGDCGNYGDVATPIVMEEKSSSVIDDLVWDLSVLKSRKAEILQVYEEEKEKFGGFLNKLSCRFSLEIVRLCDRKLLIVHYIDDCWELKTKIINQWHLDEDDIEEMKESCLALKIDSNICSVLLDHFIQDDDNNKKVIGTWFSQRGSLPFARFGPDFYCFVANILLIYTYRWEVTKIDGLRELVDYGFKSSSNKLKLQFAINNAKTIGKNVIFNDTTIKYLQWPFEYLEIAVGLKEAFSELEKIDDDFRSINLTKQKWDEATATLQHFQALNEFSYHFRWGKDNLTVVDIMKLLRCNRNEDCHVCKNASLQIKEFFDENKAFLVVAIVVILDPRFKMDTVQELCEEIYVSDADYFIEKIIKDFRDIYNEYSNHSSDDYKMMDVKGRPCTSSTTKSELNLYLNELKVPVVEEFDILTWWRDNAPFYPTLARMARDYFAIPFHRTFIDSSLHNYISFIGDKFEKDDDIVSALIYLKSIVVLLKPEKNK